MFKGLEHPDESMISSQFEQIIGILDNTSFESEGVQRYVSTFDPEKDVQICMETEYSAFFVEVSFCTVL